MQSYQFSLGESQTIGRIRKKKGRTSRPFSDNTIVENKALWETYPDADIETEIERLFVVDGLDVATILEMIGNSWLCVNAEMICKRISNTYT